MNFARDVLTPDALSMLQTIARLGSFAAAARDMGLVPGHRVLLRGGNSPMMAACLLATFKAGLVAVPTSRYAKMPEANEPAMPSALTMASERR